MSSETVGAAGVETRSGVELIAAERERQAQRYDVQHDDDHDDGSLVEAAALAALTTHASFDEEGLDEVGDAASAKWVAPWLRHCFEKHRNDPVRRLAIAGALIAAEIDRLQRLATPEAP